MFTDCVALLVRDPLPKIFEFADPITGIDNKLSTKSVTCAVTAVVGIAAVELYANVTKGVPC